MPIQLRKRTLLLLIALSYVTLVACMSQRSTKITTRHTWWRGVGPVLPHDSFPADCSLCHVGAKWQSLREDFTFDHEQETGVALVGAHRQAKCLRCHNDRGPVDVFQAQSCAGCHEDVHLGQLGPRCDSCHHENTWNPVGQYELHSRTRFPLVGVHAATACHRCHPGSEVGKFVPTDTECVTCHQSDLLRTNNPNHVALGWVDHCDRCHRPTRWKDAEAD